MTEERKREEAPEAPTVEADRASPNDPGPGDSEGARPEPPPDRDEGSPDPEDVEK
jgi:hypothetical protein